VAVGAEGEDDQRVRAIIKRLNDTILALMAEPGGVDMCDVGSALVNMAAHQLIRCGYSCRDSIVLLVEAYNLQLAQGSRPKEGT
jgi:hypothetical protein